MAAQGGRRKRGGAPQPLADLLGKVYPGKEPEDATMIRALSWWRKAVPKRVFARARPVRLRAGTLYVHTSTSAWAAELYHLRESLLASLHRSAPESRVKALRFQVGPLPELPKPRQNGAALPFEAPAAQLPESLARALAQIDDDSLRDAISRAAGVSLARRSAP